MKFTSHSEKDTLNFAKKLARKLRGGDVLALSGDLGSGKTVFAKGLAKTLGINCASSPTFVLLHLHKIKPSPTSPPPPSGRGRIKEGEKLRPKYLCHIDAYRLENAEALLEIGADEYIGNPEVITIIEWAEKVKKILPKNTKWIFFKHYPHLSSPSFKEGEQPPPHPSPLLRGRAGRGRKIENWRIIKYNS